MSAPTILDYESFSQWRTKINQISTTLNTLSADVGNKTNINLPSQERGDLVDAINAVIADLGELGNLANLTTTAKTTLVAAVNEVNGKTTATIPDSADKRYVTDAQKTVLGNTSGTNTGDQDLSSLVTTSRTVNAKALSSNITLTTADIADSADKRYVTDAQRTVVGNTSGTNTGNETAASVGTLINGATAKTTPVDADMLGLMDSEATNALKKFSWANLKTMLNGLYAVLGGVAGGQTINGGTASGNSLTLASTAHGTKGKILFGTSGYDEVNNRLGVGNSTPDQPLTVTGNATATGFVCTKFTSKSLSNGLNSNIVITSSFVRITGPTGSFSVGGFSTPIDGAMLTLYNTTAQAMTIVNEDSSSTAANRIKTLTGSNVVLSTRTSAATLIYDSTDSRWILTAYV